MTEFVAITVLVLGAALLVASVVEPAERITVSLTFPRTTTAAQAVTAARTLAGLLPPWWRRLLGPPSVTLELRADAAGITHALTLPATRSEQVIGALRVAIPGLRVADAEGAPPASLSVTRTLRVSGQGSLRTDIAAETNAGILAGLLPLGPDERAVIQYVITPTAPLPGAQLLHQIAGDESAAEADSIEPRFVVAVRVATAAATSTRSRQLLARLLGSFHPSGTPEARLTRRLLPSSLVAAALRRSYPGRMWLAADELAAVWGVPVEAPDIPGLTLAQSRERAPVAAVPRQGLVLGDSTVAGHIRPVALSLSGLRRNMLLTAPTGAGKSTALVNLATQLFIHPSRPAIVVIDSKGDLAARDLPDRIPADRISDAVLFDPADRDRPIGFNLIGGTGEADLVVDHVVSDLRARYGAAGLGPRSEDVLRASLTTLTSEPGRYSLCEVEPLLANASFRQRVLAGVPDDPVLLSFWAWYGSLSDAARAEVVAPLANKLRSFTLRRRVRAVIGQSGGLDLAEALSPGRITLISLAKGTVGADVAALLGAAMTSRLWTAIQARAAVPESQRHPAMAICDEFADFAAVSSVFPDAVAQSRGYACSWVLAHQHLGQLDRETRTAVLANCRTRLVMQTTADDARTFAREFAPHLKPDDLQGLGAYEAYAAVSTGPSVAPPASIRTRPAPDPLGSAAAVRTTSRQRYGVPPAAVDAAIRSRVQGDRPPTPVGGARRSS